MDVDSMHIIGSDDFRMLSDMFSNLSQEIRKLSATDWVEFSRTIKTFFLVGGICFSHILGICFLISGLLYIAKAMIFLKANKKSWAAVIPVYESHVLFDISIGKGFLGAIDSLLVYSILFVPLIEYVCDINCGWYTTIIGCFNFILRVFMKIKLAKKFNKGIGFGIGLILLPFIFYPILGFGKSEYNFGDTGNTKKAV